MLVTPSAWDVSTRRVAALLLLQFVPTHLMLPISGAPSASVSPAHLSVDPDAAAAAVAPAPNSIPNVFVLLEAVTHSDG